MSDAGVVIGWTHYLAFDLFVGAWICRTARAESIPHAFVLPILVPTFLKWRAILVPLRAVFAQFRGKPQPFEMPPVWQDPAPPDPRLGDLDWHRAGAPPERWKPLRAGRAAAA